MNSDKSLVTSEPQCHLSKMGILFQRDAWRIKHHQIYCIIIWRFITYHLYYSSEKQSKADVLFLSALTAQLSKDAVQTKAMLLLLDPSWWLGPEPWGWAERRHVSLLALSATTEGQSVDSGPRENHAREIWKLPQSSAPPAAHHQRSPL